MSAADSSASTPTAPSPAPPPTPDAPPAPPPTSDAPPAQPSGASSAHVTSPAEASAAAVARAGDAAQTSGDDTERVDVSIVLPCYNEEDHVIAEVERITKAMDASGLTYELLAVDDASTDNTLKLLQEAAPRFPRMRVIPLFHNGGSGTARRVGTQSARGDIVVWTDADMSYPNERIPELVQILREDPRFDQVIGARTSEQGSHRMLRVPAKWMIRKIAEWLTNTKIPDLNSGLRAFRREVSLPYLRLLPPGFSCVTTITMAFLHNQHGIRYVPIEYSKRSGRSKFHFVKDAYRYILQVLRMVMYFNPIKVLMPPALWLLAIGVGKGIYDVVAHPVRLATNTVLIFLTGLLIASLALLADLIVRSRHDP
jgi:glycosyltransferase involved in cell wall biosynthesis